MCVAIYCIEFLFLCADVLTDNLVREAITWDHKDNLNKPPRLKTSKHLDCLIAAINDCGVCFSVWEKKNADGGGSGMHQFTSLMGSAKKLLLKNLPSKLPGIIKPETSETVIKIWKVTVKYCIVTIFTDHLSYKIWLCVLLTN